MCDGLLPSNLITTPKHKIAKKSLPFAVKFWLTDKIFFIQKRLTPKRKEKRFHLDCIFFYFGHLWSVNFGTSFFLRLPFTQTSPRLHFSCFIFRALKPCDQDSPISVCNGNQSTRSQHEWPWVASKRGWFNSRFIRLLERKTHLSWEKSHTWIPDHFCGWLKLKKKPEFSNQ